MRLSIHSEKCIKNSPWTGWIEPGGKRYVKVAEKGGIVRECGWVNSRIEFKISNPDGPSNNGHVEMVKVPGQPWGKVKCLKNSGHGFRLECTGIDVFIKNP